MPGSSPVCPHCGMKDKTYKVSLLYIESTARLHHHETTNQPELDGLLRDLAPDPLQSAAQQQLLEKMIASFEPPSGKKQVTRRIHPDAMIVFLWLVGLLVIVQARSVNSPQLPMILLLLGATIVAYLTFRRIIVRRYQESVQKEKDEKEQVEEAISRWMRLYFCSREQIVFAPDENRFVPLEQMSELLSSS